MVNTQWRRNVANIIRRAPWLAKSALILWRIRQAKFTVGVVGVVFDTTGHILLVEHVFHPYHPWGLSGGWVDRRESPTETIQREMQEELELRIDVGPLLLAQIDYGNHLDLAYLCHMTGPIGKLSSELLDYRWVAPSDLPRLHHFHYQAIQNAITLRADS